MTAAKVLRDALLARLDRLPPLTSCFRWVDLELPEITVDLFDDVAILSSYSAEARDREAHYVEALHQARTLRAIYVKRRPREAKAVNTSVEEAAPPLPVWGTPLDSLCATELGARFDIRPSNGLSVGLYLDAREARAWVGHSSRGRRVLNTFAYTCGFGVAASRGAATRVVNLDLSRKVLEWGAHNYGLNGLAVERRDFVSGDTFEWLRRFEKQGEQFDLVILDPPGFATMGKGRFSAARDYHLLVAATARLLAPQAQLLAMCNVEALSNPSFEAQVLRGLAGRKVRQVASFSSSDVDFRAPRALKCLVYEVA